MDAAKRLLKTTALLPVIALLMAAPGWAQTLVVPTTVTIGSTGYASANVTSSAAGTTEIAFTVGAPNYSGDTTGSRTGWLTASSTSGTTPANLSFSIVTTAGVYSGASAVVTLTPTGPSGVTLTPVPITVTFTGNGGGGAAILASSVATATLTAGASSQASQAVAITTTSASSINISWTSSVTGNVANWLSSSTLGATTINSSAGTTLTIVASSYNLPSGTYTGTITVAPVPSTLGLPVNITVNFTVGSTVGNGSWAATPGSIAWNYNSGGSYPSQAVSISTSSGSATYSVLANSSNGWLLAYTPSNTTGATNITGIPIGTQLGLTIGNQVTSLSPGVYYGYAYIYDSSGVQQLTVGITLTVNGNTSSTLTVTPNPISFSVALNGSQQSQVVNVYSSGGGYLSINPSLPTGLSYSLPSNTYVAAGGSIAFTVYANPYQLAANTYSGTLYIYVGSQYAQVSVSMVVGGGGGSGNITISPNPVSFNVALNGSQQNQSVSVYSGYGGSLSVTSTNLPSGLLTYQFPSGTNIVAGGTVAFTVYANPSGLSAGTYSGTMYIYVGAQSTSVPVTVVVGGGGSTVLTVSPNPITFSVAVNGAQQSQTVNVYSGTGGTLSLNSALPSGLTYQLPSNTSVAAGGSIAFTVYANPGGLTANTYSGTLYVYVGGQSVSVPVSMVVGGGSGTTGTTAVAPTSLSFSYQLGTDPVNFISQQKVVITGPAGAWSSTVSTTNGIAWLSLSPSSGSSLPSPAQSPIVTVNATGLTAGTYGGTIIVTTPGGSQSISVSLSVGSTTVLLPTPGSLVFAAQTGQAAPSGQIIFFSGSDSALNPLAISAVANNSWISVTNDNTSVTVQVNPTGLSTGVYSGSVSVSQTGAANNPTPIPVILVVNGGGSGGTPPANSNVTVTPTSLSYSAAAGSSPADQSLSITSTSGSASVSFTVTATTTSGGSWLSTKTTSGSTPFNPLAVSVNSSALAAGTYNGNIAIAPAGGTTVNIPVYLTVSVPVGVSATPTALTFTYRAGDAAPASQPVTVSGSGSAFTATASSNGSWLVASPGSGTAPGTVNVSINPTGLSAGTYNGTVVVNGASGAAGSTAVNVTLTVTAPLPTISKVTNAASYATGSLSPGEIITLFANDPTHPIGPATPAGLTLDSNGKVSTSIGGVQVTVGGYLCPLIYVSASQISAVVPYEIKQFVSANVLVKFLGQTSNGVLMNVATTVPGIFTANSSGTGPGAILNSNGSVNSPSNPAARGDTVVVYLTGEGETSPFGVTGKVTTVASPPAPLTPGPLLQPTVLIGGQPANWSFAGEAPGFVSGVMQLNVIVPTNIAATDQSIVVNFGSNPSQTGVTVSVK
jgi:uncharacterized protein (TIGR03437 family)